MIEHPPLISVVMPAYNTADTLPVALNGLRHQTLEDWECLLVDDGSTDSTLDVAQAEAACDSRIRVISQVHAGQDTARNTGISKARGRFIAYHDADDFSRPQRFVRQLAVLDSGDWQVTYTGMTVTTGDPSYQGHDYPAQPFSRKRLLRHDCIPLGSIMHRRECLDTVGPWGKDGDWGMKLRLSRTYQVKAVAECLYCYRQSAGGVYARRGILGNRRLELKIFRQVRRAEGGILLAVKVGLLAVNVAVLRVVRAYRAQWFADRVFRVAEMALFAVLPYRGPCRRQYDSAGLLP